MSSSIQGGPHGERAGRGEGGCLACQWQIDAEGIPTPVEVVIDRLSTDFWMCNAEELGLSMEEVLPVLEDDTLRDLRRDLTKLGEGRRSISATVLYIPKGLSVNRLLTKFKPYWEERYPCSMKRLRESLTGTRQVEKGYWIAMTNVIFKGVAEEDQALRLIPLRFKSPKALDALAVAIVVEQVWRKNFFASELFIIHTDRSAQTATMGPVHTKCLEDLVIGSWVRPESTGAPTPTRFPIGMAEPIKGEEFILGDDFKVSKELMGVCATRVL